MKLTCYLVAEMIELGNIRGAAEAILAHFGSCAFTPDSEIVVHRHSDRDNDHVLIYTSSDWYEWGSSIGFRSGPLSSSRHRSRAVAWLRK